MGQGNGSDVKRLYVNTAYELLSSAGFEGVSAREIARIVGKTPPAVYRHFPSIDYLSAVASVRALMPYYKTLSALVPSRASALDVNIQTWECFAFYALKNVSMYENFFANGGFEGLNPIEDYFELFPEERVKVGDIINAPVRLTDLRDRDAYMIRCAVEEGYIAAESVEYLVDCDELFLRGLFQEYRDVQIDELQAREVTKKFVGLIYRNYTNCLLPGKRIMADFTSRYTLY